MTQEDIALEQAKVVLDELRSVARRNYALTVQRKLAESDACCPGCDWASVIRTAKGDVIGWECAQTGRREMIV